MRLHIDIPELNSIDDLEPETRAAIERLEFKVKQVIRKNELLKKYKKCVEDIKVLGLRGTVDFNCVHSLEFNVFYKKVTQLNNIREVLEPHLGKFEYFVNSGVARGYYMFANGNCELYLDSDGVCKLIENGKVENIKYKLECNGIEVSLPDFKEEPKDA